MTYRTKIVYFMSPLKGNPNCVQITRTLEDQIFAYKTLVINLFSYKNYFLS